MLLSLVVHSYSLRYWLPAAVMLGTAPAYLLCWSACRLLTGLLPARLFHTVDDRVYSVYQSMVLFFFENYTGVEIVIYGDIPKKENVVYLSNHQSTEIRLSPGGGGRIPVASASEIVNPRI